MARTGATFERHRSPFPRTLAGQRYRVDSLATNAYFWVSDLAEGGLNGALRGADETQDPLDALSLNRRTYYGRLGHDVATLRERIREHSRWRRLLTLVMMSAALERYMHAAASAAVASDPLVVASFPKLIDGAVLAKRGLPFPARDLGGILTGTWSKRVAAYRSLFGDPPLELEQHLADLEFLRKARNRVAHSLGVDDGYSDEKGRPHAGVVDTLLGARRPGILPSVAVSDARITKLMAVTQRVVDAVDKDLGSRYIGGYELVAVCLEWAADPAAFEVRVGVSLSSQRKRPDERFRNVLGDLFGSTPGARYVETLEQYVKSL